MICLQEAISANADSKTIKDLVKELKIRGGHDQLLMFLSGPAGAGKTLQQKWHGNFVLNSAMQLILHGMMQHLWA